MTSSHHASASPSTGLWTGSLTDFRHAFRLLWKSKRITATTLVTLALCIGATTAIFSSVYSLMLKPLPYQEPERIVELYSSAEKAGLNTCRPTSRSISITRRTRRRTRAWVWTFVLQSVGDKDSVLRTPGVRMTANLQHPAVAARARHLLHKGAEQTGQRQGDCAHAVLLADAVQESPEVIGKEVRIDDEAYKVIGVAPRELEAFDARMKFVVPLSWPAQAENPQGRYGVGIQLFGRLKPA
jgi:hypothetical protein